MSPPDGVTMGAMSHSLRPRLARVARPAITLGIALGITLQCATAAAQCTKDTDCKESRLCEKGTCVEPGEVKRPKVPPHPFDYQKVYAQVAGVLSLHAWHGTFHGDVDNVGVHGGVHAAVYAVSSTTEHYGGYFSYVDFPGGSQLHAGLSMKEGRRRFTRVWLGGVVDLGAFFLLAPQGQRGYGVELFPRFELDVILGASSKVRSAIFFAAGPMLVPYFHWDTGVAGVSHNRWLVGIQLLAGVLFGS
jgi:hypothetical protein